MPDSHRPQPPFPGFERCDTPEAALFCLKKLYEEARAGLAAQFEAFQKGETPRPAAIHCYPELVLKAQGRLPPRSAHAAGKFAAAGLYASSITAPGLFSDYLLEQLDVLMAIPDITAWVGPGRTPIPLPYAVERASLPLSPLQRQTLSAHFSLPDLAATHDAIADGVYFHAEDAPAPLSLFTAPRIDYSLHRLRHYTGTDPAHMQSFILLTNYQRYVDEFAAWGRAEVAAGRYDALIEPGGGSAATAARDADRPPFQKLPQMPAYHLTRKGRNGVSLINIGVGPSNAKTITDHLAVLRPHVWLMIGHCGGLRRSQRLGDYVLAHAYLRDDHVLDDSLPVEIPLPSLAEVQVALSRAVSEITGVTGGELKDRLRTGTVVTTDDRNWELRYDVLAVRLNQSRAIAIDMESATIAANGYRFRVPYGTLLCVSDRPLHGEIKLPGMADAFYEERVAQHLQIGLRALDLLRGEAAAGTLHSRKLRSFEEPLFR